MKQLLLILTIVLQSVFSSNSQDSLQFALVKNINLTPLYQGFDNSSYPIQLVVSGGNLFFVAYDQAVGDELYISDGTNAGTHLLKNINTHLGMPFEEGSNPSNLTPYGNKIIFKAYDHDHGIEPWISDGTAAGTFILNDTDTIVGIDTILNSNPVFFTEYNNKIYFNAQGGFGEELYVSDGTEPGTYMLKDIFASWLWASYPALFYEYNNLLYFNAKGSTTNGYELWVTDGTEIGTVMFKDLSFFNEGSFPVSFYEYQGKMYFSARDLSIGRELWVCDGTVEGTILFADINPIIDEGSEPHSFVELNNLLYFWASDGVHDFELWFTNGDSVYMVKDINPSGSSFGTEPFHIYNGKLYFPVSLDEYATPVLWVSDGTEVGTYQLNACDSTIIYEPKEFINWNNQLVFLAHQYDSNNYQIWITDGTQENTKQMFHDSLLGAGWVTNNSLCLYNDEIFFSANFIDTIGSELFKIFYGPSGNIVEDYNQYNNLKVYPNPFTDHIIVDFGWNSNIKTIDIIDLSGRKVYSYITQKLELRLSLSFLEDGIYILNVKDKKNTYSNKIIKH